MDWFQEPDEEDSTNYATTSLGTYVLRHEYLDTQPVTVLYFVYDCFTSAEALLAPSDVLKEERDWRIDFLFREFGYSPENWNDGKRLAEQHHHARLTT